VAINLIKERVPGRDYAMLFRQNKADGFDCPGCAWPDREHASTFEFCENGVKAVAAESTGKRVTAAFLAHNTVASLMEDRLRTGAAWPPDRARDVRRCPTYRPVSLGRCLRADRHAACAPCPIPTRRRSTVGPRQQRGRVPVPAVRARYGTNNFPDCSNMCHEATSRGMPHWAWARAR
jgi:hypothetical protein